MEVPRLPPDPLPWPQRRFLEFVARHPEALRRESFGLLDEHDDLMPYQMQSWPLFIGKSELAGLARAAVEVCALVNSLPQRVFECDPARIAEYYRMPEELALLVTSVIARTDGLSGTVARLDVLLTAAGFKCCEVNVAANLGGAELGDWTERYLRVPLIRRFIAEAGLRVSYTDPARVLFGHVLAQAARRGLAAGGELNTAIVLEQPVTPLWCGHFERLYRAALAEASLSGELTVCRDAELSDGGGFLRCGDRRIHVVLDCQEGVVGRPILSALLAGTAQAYNGPVSRLLSDKLNLALLSELEDSGLFAPEEQAIIRTYVPWTRRVAEEFVDYRGERAYLPDLLLAERERLVLKLGLSAHGDDVYAGPFTSPDRWEGLVRAALEHGGWIAQEFLEAVGTPLQHPDGGSVSPYQIVWGPFVCGRRYGGCFLRVQPAGTTGVINNARGAHLSLVIEVEDPPAPPQ
jgi:hypothetical protein